MNRCHSCKRELPPGGRWWRHHVDPHDVDRLYCEACVTLTTGAPAELSRLRTAARRVAIQRALWERIHAVGGGAGAQVRHLALDGPRLGLAVGRDASGEGRVDHHSSLPVGAGPRSGRAGRGPRCTGPLLAGTSRAEARSTLARASGSGSNTTRTTNLAAASPSRILRFSLRNASRDPAREHRTAGEPQPPSAGVNAQPVPPEDDREPEPGPGACAIVQVVRRVWRQWQACWSRPPEAPLPLAG